MSRGTPVPRSVSRATPHRGAVLLGTRLLWRAARYRWKLNPQQIRAMRRLLPCNGVALDVGAHKGAYSCLMAWRVGPRGRVLAFEPQDRLIPGTAASLRALGLSNVTLIHAAVSDRSGADSIAIRRSSTHGASLEGLTGDDVEHQPLTLVTLDEVIEREGLERIDFVKIDVEGHELSVLGGGRRILERFRPALLIEIEARHHTRTGDGPLADVRSLLEPLGYRGFFFSRSGERPVEEFSFQTHQAGGFPAGAGPDLTPGGEYCNDFLFTAAAPPAAAAP